MNTGTLVSEATCYLEVIDLFRSLELDVAWRPEADEVRALRTAELSSEVTCGRCASPRVRINGQHVCFGIN